METIPLLSEEMVIEQRNGGHKTDNIRDSPQRTTKTYLYYNSKFLEYINKSPEAITENEY